MAPGDERAVAAGCPRALVPYGERGVDGAVPPAAALGLHAGAGEQLGVAQVVPLEVHGNDAWDKTGKNKPERDERRVTVHQLPRPAVAQPSQALGGSCLLL